MNINMITYMRKKKNIIRKFKKNRKMKKTNQTEEENGSVKLRDPGE